MSLRSDQFDQIQRQMNMSKRQSKNLYPAAIVADDIIEMLRRRAIDGVILVARVDSPTLNSGVDDEWPMLDGRDYIVLQLTERLPIPAGVSYLALSDEAQPEHVESIAESQPSADERGGR